MARALSKMGYCSRSQAGALIEDKRVRVNGRIARDTEEPVRFPDDRIEVDGVRVVQKEVVYLVVNKPRGLVTTASDERGRTTIYSLLDPGAPWVSPVGRLDKASEGLLLLTNDSEWAARIADPRSHLDKIYHVQVNRIVDADLLARITEGCTVDSDRLRAKEARLLRYGDKNSWLEITLDEGKNRQIRRLLDALDVGVLRLVRVSIGPLNLGELSKGSVRPLTIQEKQALDRALVEGKAPKKTTGACR